jgi:hypothetical protein
MTPFETRVVEDQTVLKAVAPDVGESEEGLIEAPPPAPAELALESEATSTPSKDLYAKESPLVGAGVPEETNRAGVTSTPEVLQKELPAMISRTCDCCSWNNLNRK